MRYMLTMSTRTFMERMLKLESANIEVTEETFVLGGVKFYLYNVDKVRDHVESFVWKDDSQSEITINVLYLVHQREGDHTYTEAVGKQIILHFRKFNESPLMAITFDSRNHGERTVNFQRNKSWDEGNSSHGLDMASCIDGDIHDIKLAIDYLPVHLNLSAHLGILAKDVKFRFRNILSGFSLGAHTVIRMAARYPDLTAIVNPNIGCAYLSNLLITRLRNSRDYAFKYYAQSYKDLNLTTEQQVLYPKPLHEILASDDHEIANNFPHAETLVFANFYSGDPLVPSKVSASWVKAALNLNSESQAFYEEGAVHDITFTMVQKFEDWLVKIL